MSQKSIDIQISISRLESRMHWKQVLSFFNLEYLLKEDRYKNFVYQIELYTYEDPLDQIGSTFI